MGKLKEFIPKLGSGFIKIKCSECGNEQTTFDKASSKVYCNVCKTLLVEPTGGRAVIKGGVVEELS